MLVNLIGELEPAVYAGALEVKVLTKDGALLPELSRRCAIEAVSGGRDILRSAVAADHLVICGGTHAHDSFAGRRLAYQYASMGKHALIAATTRAGGGCVHWVGVGYGPFARPISRVLARLTSLPVSSVTARDSASLRELAALVHVSPMLGADLAIPRADLESGQSWLRLASFNPPETDSVVIAPTKLLAPGTAGHTVAVGLAAHVVKNLLKRGDAAPVLYAQKCRGAESDEAIVGDVFSCLTRSEAVRTARASFADGLGRSVELFTSAKLCVVSRFHGLLLAAVLGKPTVVTPYHPKVWALCKELGIAERAIVDPTSSSAAAVLRDRVNEACAEPSEFIAPDPLGRFQERRDLTTRSLRAALSAEDVRI